MSFTEDDEKTLVNFMNMVAKHAEFNLKTEDIIKYFNLLAHMQKEILPKLKANILEVKRVVEPEESEESEGSEESKEK